MHRTSSALIAALLLCAPPLHAAPADGSGAIQQAYSAMSVGYAQKDLAKACAHLAPNFTGTDTTGVSENLQRYQFGLSSLFAECINVRYTGVVQKVSITKTGQAVAVVRESLAMTYLDPNTLRKSSIISKDVAEDVWVRTAQGWRQRSSRNLSQSATTNGRPGRPIF